MSAPRAIAHIGISVPDVDAAVRWYGDVFGFSEILPAGEIDVGAGGQLAELVAGVFGPALKRVKIGHLATANGTAIELFEFVEPPYEPPAEHFSYWRGGIFHFSIVAEDLDELGEVIVAAGGKLRSPVEPLFDGQPYRCCYCEDPWGTVIELLSHTHERTLSNQVFE